MTSSLAWTSANTSTTPASSIPKADAGQGQADAMGASLDIVISYDMGKGGAMVNGQPALNDGMGAQVWAVMACLLYTSPSPRDV